MQQVDARKNHVAAEVAEPAATEGAAAVSAASEGAAAGPAANEATAVAPAVTVATEAPAAVVVATEATAAAVQALRPDQLPKPAWHTIGRRPAGLHLGPIPECEWVVRSPDPEQLKACLLTN